MGDGEGGKILSFQGENLLPFQLPTSNFPLLSSKVAVMTGRGQTKTQRISLATRAGTIFPVGRIRRYLKTWTFQQRSAIGAPIYQAAVMEYLSAEILELAGNAARDNKRSRITPRHILLAVANDEELHKLLKNVTIPQGGVMPHILPELLKKKRQQECT